MGYLHIENLYKPEAQNIFMFREVYALEKIHGTSAHITFKTNPSNRAQWQVVFFSGGEKYNNFVGLFDDKKLIELFLTNNPMPDKEYTVYGEAYGGSQQGMSDTYGPRLKFVAFDVLIGETWLDVPNGEKFVKSLGLEYVDYVKVPIVKAVDGKVETDLTFVDFERDKPSIQAVRNGVSSFVGHNVLTEQDGVVDVPGVGCILNQKKREGVVLRPLVEVRRSNGDRIIAKHKGDDFKETKTARAVVDPNKLQVLTEATAIADEWVTPMRLEHVLDKLPGHCMEKMRDIIVAMQEDVRREASGEIVWNDSVAKVIGKKTVDLYKALLKSQIPN